TNFCAIVVSVGMSPWAFCLSILTFLPSAKPLSASALTTPFAQASRAGCEVSWKTPIDQTLSAAAAPDAAPAVAPDAAPAAGAVAAPPAGAVVAAAAGAVVAAAGLVAAGALAAGLSGGFGAVVGVGGAAGAQADSASSPASASPSRREAGLRVAIACLLIYL